MRAVVSVDEMKAIDAEAGASVPVDQLVGRAGAALARSVLGQMGGAYGRRVVVVAGKGHNGDDGRVAAARLRRRGVRVSILDAASCPPRLPPCDVVIDAAFGTGFRGEYRAPVPAEGSRVVAVDIPSGVHGDTGEACDGAVRAQSTVTFAALKPGLLLGDGPPLAGEIAVADIGLDVSRARQHLVEDADALPAERPRDTHKWQAAVMVVAGSPGMMGSAHLAAGAALHSGPGMVRLGLAGVDPADLPVGDAVAVSLPASGWDASVLEDLHRFAALVVGPGIGRSEAAAPAVRRLVAEAACPVVVDADGLHAIGSAESIAKLTAAREHAVVLTPHDGEFTRLAGRPPGPDRIDAARRLAAAAGAVVLLKGPTTVVAEPGGAVLLAAAGSPRLATPGTGDVLAGMIGAFLARGMPAPRAAAAAAHVHGAAARLGPKEGLVAGDLLELVPRWLSGQRRGEDGG